MAIDTRELAPEQLRELTLGWLRDQLPVGWMDAVDAGDGTALAQARRGLDYAEWCVRFG